MWRYGETQKKHLSNCHTTEESCKNCKPDNYNPTDALFINLHALKFYDLVNLKTAQIIYKEQNSLLPNCIQRLFEIIESQYELSGIGMSKKTRVMTNIKNRCISVKGVNFLNSCDKELKMYSSLQKKQTHDHHDNFCV